MIGMGYYLDNSNYMRHTIISQFQVIKMYAWEIPFTKLIAYARKMELNIVRKNSYVRGLYMTFLLFTTRMALFCTMMSIVLLYGSDQLTAAKVESIYIFCRNRILK